MTIEDKFELLVDIIESKSIGIENVDLPISTDALFILTIRNKLVNEILEEFCEKADI